MAAARNFRIGSALARPGKRVEGELVLGHYPDAPIATKVTIVSGTRPGPVLWVQGCIHGPEVGGVVAMLRLLERLDPRRMRGSIACIMLANPTAFRGYSRNTPVDTTNLNRVFPGAADGTHSQQNAHVLIETAASVADAVLDLHSGGDRSRVPYYGLYWAENSDASREAGRLARACGTRDIWASIDDWLGGAMFTVLTKRGIPSLIVECGGGGQVPEAHVANFVAAMTGVAQSMGILPGRPKRFARYRVFDESALIYSRKGGLFRPLVEPGDIVEKGHVLGEIVDLSGKVVERPRASIGPSYIASIRRPWMPVYSGDQIAECNRVIAS
ncbi:MAG: hypothetical protein FJX46_01400 [Alphaproteobacteria bacterium]|nr:hypothetical protein [Alphaproteobacteria bacterium]